MIRQLAIGSEFSFAVDRVCRIRREGDGDEFTLPLDDAGFLDASAPRVMSVEAISPGALVAPELAVQAGPLVLLGEPGIGKSTTFEGLVADRRHVWVDAADLTDVTFDELVGRHLQDLPETPDVAASSDTAPVVVVLDQIDESPIVRRLAGSLQRGLEGRDVSRLLLMLACRTADYPQNLTDALRASGIDPVLADLVPLTRDQAVQLADSAEGVIGADLIEVAVEVGAGVLASVPLTLAMLVRTYRKRGELEPHPRKLFGDGVVQLADEPDEDRRGTFVSTTDQRLAVAGRTAAHLLLSGRRTLWRGAQLEAGHHDLRAEALAGGHELMTGGRVDVSPQLVDETLATALFTGRGENRLAFRHGSIAAYLAARYINDRQIPRRQLETLFLVPDVLGNRSIPTLLRETAAWLVTLAPEHAQWLADADPESLVGHSRIVDSEATRALIVDALLQRADEVELADAPWARAPRRLDHPGLADQLREVLDVAGASEPEDWPSAARVRLAVRLAHEAGVTGLADPLLRLAESDSWGSRVRQLASMAAHDTEPDEAVPKLTSVLQRLAEPDHASEVDPDDELRGTLLMLLWPDHLAVEDILPHLRARANRNLIGMYLRFEREFARRLREEDLPAVLDWARERVSGRATTTVSRASDDTQVEESDHREVVGDLDEEQVEGIIDRALSGPTATEHIQDVARLLLRKLNDHGRPPLPAPLDLQAGDGTEPPAARRLRRSLAKELTVMMAREVKGRPQADAWTVINGWTGSEGTWRGPDAAVPEGTTRAGRSRLLDERDFEWAHEEATTAHDAGDEPLAKAMAQLAVFLFDPTDPSSVDLVYQHPHGPVWDELEHWFEPVKLDGGQAARMREAHASSLEQPDEEEPSPQAGEFATTQRRRLRAAVDGDGDAFWRLAWDMQFPPKTLTGHPRLDDDVRDFPGLEVLEGDQVVRRLTEASLSFLQVERDYRDEWLGTGRYDKRAWAGYLALALVEREGRLDEVPHDRWQGWVGALVWFSAVPVNAGDRKLKQRLLERAARHAPTELAEAAAVYLRGELALGRLGSEIELIDPRWDPQLATTLHQLLVELTAALTSALRSSEEPDEEESEAEDRTSVPSEDDTPPDLVQLPAGRGGAHPLMIWEAMLAAVVPIHAETQELALQVLRAGTEDADVRPLAAKAAVILLQHDAARWWPTVRNLAQEHPDLGRAIATAGAVARDYRAVLAELPDAELGELYRLLADLFPPEDDPHHTGTHFVSPEEQARSWRDSVINQLAERGTNRAVTELAALKEEFPTRLIIASYLIRARTLAGESAWTPPHPDELARLFEDARRRLVRSNGELAGVIIELLIDIADDVGSHGDLLWDRIPGRTRVDGLSTWLPKREASLTAYLTNELRHRLRGRALIVNREVLVQQTDEYGAGDRTDVLIESPAFEGSTIEPRYERVAVVLEVKCPWNVELKDAQRSQLAERYLPEAATDHGVYLVGWYPIDLWTDQDDYARAKAARLDPVGLMDFLRDQAAEIRTDLSVVTIPIVLSVPRSHRSDDETEIERGEDDDGAT